MSTPIEAAVEAGSARGETPDAAMRHHLLEGLLRRLAASPVADDFVVRGGLMTRVWSPGRTTRDLDVVGDHPFDIAATTERLRVLCAVPVDDGLHLDSRAVRTQGIWLHTEFPGVRARIPVGFSDTVIVVTADVGFGDPLVPPAQLVDYPALVGPPPRIRACAPETQTAWKLHGLAEQGPQFRPKDLADLRRIVEGVPLDGATLAPAIEAAFLSRGFTRAQAQQILDAPFWTTKSARVRWRDAGAPGELGDALDVVRAALGPSLSALPADGSPGG